MDKIVFEVCYTKSPTDIFHISAKIESGTTIRQAFVLLSLDKCFPLKNKKLGVFAKLVSDDYIIQDGDRIEIYRPLKISPMEARRARIKKG